MRIIKQIGKSDEEIDRMLKAKPPGWRTSKSKKRYWESRKNRSDQLGKRI